MERCWVLVGMMGAGKSAVGRALAELSGREFVDTDLLLQHRFGRPVGQIFDYYGEETFRDHETSILKGLQPAPVVLSTGGGIVLREANWEQIRRLGRSIYLSASAEILTSRLAISKKRRPLLATEDWEARIAEILAFRSPLYLQADFTFGVETSTVAEVALHVYGVLKDLRDDDTA